jgi:hypothetical protein
MAYDSSRICRLLTDDGLRIFQISDRVDEEKRKMKALNARKGREALLDRRQYSREPFGRQGKRA